VDDSGRPRSRRKGQEVGYLGKRALRHPAKSRACLQSSASGERRAALIREAQDKADVAEGDDACLLVWIGYRLHSDYQDGHRKGGDVRGFGAAGGGAQED